MTAESGPEIPETAQVLFARARARHRANDREGAEALYRTLLVRWPDHAGSLHHLGLLALQRGRTGEAVALIGRAAALAPDQADPQADLAIAWRAMGRPDAAQAAARAALTLCPDHAPAAATLISLLLEGGETAMAVARARTLVERHPGWAGGWYLLGNALARSDARDEAIAAYRRAVALDPGHVAAHNNLGGACEAQGRLEEARDAYGRAAALAPGDPLPRYNLGNVLAAAGEGGPAAEHYRAALALRPDFQPARTNLGNVLLAAGAIDEAIALYRAGLERPDGEEDPDLRYNLANALVEAGRMEEAVAAFAAVLAHRPDHVLALNNLASALVLRGDMARAGAVARAALARQPSLASAWLTLGKALAAEGRTLEALEAFKSAIALHPDNADAHNTLGCVFSDLGRPEAAIAAYRRAIALSPQVAEPHCNLGMALLRQGAWDEGWREYEWRWRLRGGRPKRRTWPAPPWRGEDLAGRVLFLHSEQGYGDVLQFVRFAPVLAARGARVIVGVYRPLARLLAGLAGAERVVSEGDALPPIDFHCPMMSAPGLLGLTPETLPAWAPYVHPAGEEMARWAGRLAGGAGLRVGLVWAGASRPDDPVASQLDRRRSIAPARLASLLAVPGVRFVSLQAGPAAAQAGEPPLASRLFDPMDEAMDFADTAAIVANLDLVISVDTAVAHLAGAMGKPVWILSRFDGCWRWMGHRADSPWYPTARLFHQDRPGDWEGVVARVAAALRGGGPGAQSGLSPTPNRGEAPDPVGF